ncbi:hypothetical protein I550_1543 [Mycobacterium intracellulare 1956]|uniref:Uncharacterized protein n=1 Tax=Mycobacterium intracellulare 1956 TaxID=1299331 RepID=X8CT42_MYCIT|nr:hypothetical protein I550_1543 [Mycobacterium intracellulare 1956]
MTASQNACQPPRGGLPGDRRQRQQHDHRKPHRCRPDPQGGGPAATPGQRPVPGVAAEFGPDCQRVRRDGRHPVACV